MAGWPSLRDWGPDGPPTTEEWERFRVETASPAELRDCRHGNIRISCTTCRQSDTPSRGGRR